VECMRCKTTEGVKMESSRTAYHTDLPFDHPDNPNADVPLCPDCAEEHHEFWSDMWSNVPGH